MPLEHDFRLFHTLGQLVRAHPWHGVFIGPDAPHKVVTYIEIVPTDTVKYELDKVTGLLRVDRPQLYSNFVPALYGLVPQTLCGERVADYCRDKTGLANVTGDKDPLDICVLTEKAISHGDILLRATPIGGLRMLDGEEADDKIIAVLDNDAAFGAWQDIADCPARVLERLRHYFLTYKDVPGSPGQRCKITHVYNRAEAHEVIRRSQEDYRSKYSDLELLLRKIVAG
jgi:inorganic pyrophosphatase